MKVISLLQPWATLVVIGAKRIETRSWQTKHRGDLLIHASKKMSQEQIDLTQSEPFWSVLQHLEQLQLGKIIGKVKVLDIKTTEWCVDMAPAFEGDWDQEKAFGDYSKGRYGWILSKPELFDTPIEKSGNRSIWNFPMCHICGCWDLDACIHPKDGNCSWAEEDLCSNCKLHPGEAKRYSIMMKERMSKIRNI